MISTNRSAPVSILVGFLLAAAAGNTAQVAARQKWEPIGKTIRKTIEQRADTRSKHEQRTKNVHILGSRREDAQNINTTLSKNDDSGKRQTNGQQKTIYETRTLPTRPESCFGFKPMEFPIQEHVAQL